MFSYHDIINVKQFYEIDGAETISFFVLFFKGK